MSGHTAKWILFIFLVEATRRPSNMCSDALQQAIHGVMLCLAIWTRHIINRLNLSRGPPTTQARHTVQLPRAAFASCCGATGGRSSPSVGVVALVSCQPGCLGEPPAGATPGAGRSCGPAGAGRCRGHRRRGIP